MRNQNKRKFAGLVWLKRGIGSHSVLDQLEAGCLRIVPGIGEVPLRLDAHIGGIGDELAAPGGREYGGLRVVVKVVLVIGSIALLLDTGLATLHKGPVPLGGQDNGLRAEAVEVVGVGHVLVLATDLRHIVDGSVRILELSVPALTLDGDIVLFLPQWHL